MTVTVPPTAAASALDVGSRGPGEVRRALALAKVELILLRRNRTALFTALLTPLLLVAMFGLLPNGTTGASAVLGLVIGSALLFVVYYTLVTSVVARREQHTLKRLYTSPAHPATILVGMGLPLLALLLIQVAVGLGAIAAFTGVDASPRLALLVLAALGGAVLWSVLALVSSVFTRTVEAAQLTTLPLILVALLFGGLSVPLALVPDVLQNVAQATPMFPVVDLAFLALGPVRVTSEVVEGSALLRAVGTDVAVMAAWVAVGVSTLRRRFRWEPRR